MNGAAFGKAVARLALTIGLGWAMSSCQGGAGAPSPAPPPAVPNAVARLASAPPAGFSLVPVSYTGPAITAPAPEQAPSGISLVTADGIALTLKSLSARSVVQGPLAFTELRLSFVNSEPRIVEGQLRMTLPPGAAVSRLAMRIGEQWQEGEVVERQRAKRAYEDFLHRKQDPALLEQAAGNELAARVFPIGARETKEIIVSYSQERSGQATTLVPLRAVPSGVELDVAVRRDGSDDQLSLQQASFAPGRDVELAATLPGVPDGLRSGDLAVARIRPQLEAERAPLSTAVVLVDTSGSRALGLGPELDALRLVVGQVVAQGGAGAPLVVAAFDQGPEAIYHGPASGFGQPHIDGLARRGALGASNLESALRWAGSASAAAGIRRVVVITDGVATAGAAEPAAVRRAASALRDSGVERIDALVVGGIRDEAALRAVVSSGLPHDGVVLDAARPAVELAARLGATTVSGLAVSVPSARWSWPTKLDGLQPGDDVLVYAELPGEMPLRVEVGGKPVAVPELAFVARPLLERSWANAKIASLLAREGEGGPAAELRQEIISLATRYRVVSPYTALLVLETERDYERFGLDRTALRDILTIDAGRLQIVQRAQPAPLKPTDTGWGLPPVASRARGEEGSMGTALSRALPPAPTGEPPAPGDPVQARGNMWGDAIGESFGTGGLGLSGVGVGGGGTGEGIGLGQIGTIGHGAGSGTGQGFGAGSGRLGRSHRTDAPTVRMGATQVSGRIPPEVIQRVVRQSFGRFRLCYEQALGREPGLAGRVVLRFVIGQNGSVQSVNTRGSEIQDPTMLACVQRSMGGLRFPAPEGGIVTVAYPIVFAPGDGSVSRATTSAQLADPPPPDPAPEPGPRNLLPKDDGVRGPLAEVRDAIHAGRTADALARATAWHAREPGDVLALVALGQALEAAGAQGQAARAYGSIIDLFPWRADLRRFAGGQLERVGTPSALELAADDYRRAVAQRPDHPSSHRMLAFALLRQGEPGAAFDVLVTALKQAYPDGRFRGAARVLREDLGLAAAAWIKAFPAFRGYVLAKLQEAGGTLEAEPSLRFVLTWETDANDVDLHVLDDSGGHAFYGERALASGGELYEDVTTGYGPECFTVRRPGKWRSPSYQLRVQYYAQGPMGYGMGKVQVVRHDGAGGLRFEERPFVIMNAHTGVDLGSVASES